jgi:hypothetical protein
MPEHVSTPKHVNVKEKLGLMAKIRRYKNALEVRRTDTLSAIASSTGV